MILYLYNYKLCSKVFYQKLHQIILSLDCNFGIILIIILFSDVKKVQRNDHEKIQAKEERKRREGRKELLLMKKAKIILRYETCVYTTVVFKTLF